MENLRIHSEYIIIIAPLDYLKAHQIHEPLIVFLTAFARNQAVSYRVLKIANRLPTGGELGACIDMNGLSIGKKAAFVLRLWVFSDQLADRAFLRVGGEFMRGFRIDGEGGENRPEDVHIVP